MKKSILSFLTLHTVFSFGADRFLYIPNRYSADKPCSNALARMVFENRNVLDAEALFRTHHPVRNLKALEIGLNPPEIANRFEKRFGFRPKAILLVGTQAEGKAGPTSDIDIFLVLPPEKLAQHPYFNQPAAAIKEGGKGFDFMKDLNPGKIPAGVKGIGPDMEKGQYYLGDPELPKAGVVDPFFGPASKIKPQHPAILIWTENQTQYETLKKYLNSPR